MHLSKSQLVAVLLLTLFAGLVASSAARAQSPGDVCASPDLDVPAAECAALIHFYQSTGGPNWTAPKEGWAESPTVCDWTGLGCTTSGAATHVTSLVLQSKNLNGSLPPSLALLTHLNTLDLYDNFLSGSIPVTLGSLDQLTYLDLGLNLFEGSVPYPLSASTAPLFLFLDGNRLSGPLPAEYCTANLASATARYNALDVLNTDPCFDTLSVFPDWDISQTVPPLGVTAVLKELGNETGTGAVSTATIELSWTPVAFAEGEGGYAIFFGSSTLGPFTRYQGVVQGKGAASALVEFEGDPRSRVFIVRTFSGPSERNKNTLVSTESNTARVEGVALTLLATEAGSPTLYLVLLGPLALLLVTAGLIYAARRRTV